MSKIVIENGYQELYWELKLIRDSFRFLRSWLCWRKWLHSSGILGWASDGVLISNGSGEMFPFWYYDGSWVNFLSKTLKDNGKFCPSNSLYSVNLGKAIDLIERRKNLINLERKWCTYNSADLFNNPFSLNINSDKYMFETFYENIPRWFIEDKKLVSFYKLLLQRLKNILDDKFVVDEQHNDKDLFTIDSTLCTFDDYFLNLYQDLLFSTCGSTDKINEIDILKNGEFFPFKREVQHFLVFVKLYKYNYSSVDRILLSVVSSELNSLEKLSLTLKFSDLKSDLFGLPHIILSNYLNLSKDDLYVIPRRFIENFIDNINFFPYPFLKLNDLRSLLNYFYLPRYMDFLSSPNVLKRSISYSNLFVKLWNNFNSVRNVSTQEQIDNIGGIEIYSSDNIDNILRMLQLKVIAIYNVSALGIEKPSTNLSNFEENSQFFSYNEFVKFGVLTKAFLILSKKFIISNVNTFKVENCKLLDPEVYDGKIKKEDHNNGVSRIFLGDYSVFQNENKSEEDNLKERIQKLMLHRRFDVSDVVVKLSYQIYVTSVFFSYNMVSLCLREKSYDNSIIIDNELLLKHEYYDNILMCLLCSSSAPQFGSYIEPDDNFSKNEGSNYRLVLIRLSHGDNFSISNESRFVSNYESLCSRFALSGFVYDIIRYLDPSFKYVDKLMKIDPYYSQIPWDGSFDDNLSGDRFLVDLSNFSSLKNVSIKSFCNTKFSSLLKFYSKEKSLVFFIMRNSPLTYSPEGVFNGITLSQRGIVPLEIGTNRDTWKIYIDQRNFKNFCFIDDFLKRGIESFRDLPLQNLPLVGVRDCFGNNFTMYQTSSLDTLFILLKHLKSEILIPIFSLDLNIFSEPLAVLKIVSKRVYLINGVIGIFEQSTKVYSDSLKKFNGKIDYIHFANFNLNGNLFETFPSVITRVDPKNQLSPDHFYNVVFRPIVETISIKGIKVRLVDEVLFFVIEIGFIRIWFPKVNILYSYEETTCLNYLPHTVGPFVDHYVRNILQAEKKSSNSLVKVF